MNRDHFTGGAVKGIKKNLCVVYYTMLIAVLRFS